MRPDGTPSVQSKVTVQHRVFFFIPAGFDAAADPVLAEHADAAHWLLNRIVSLSHSYRHDGRDFVNISAQTMRTFMQPPVVTQVKDALVRGGVIECDGVYRPQKFRRDGDGKSYGYRIAAAHVGGLKRVECRDPRFAARVLKHRIVVRDEPLDDWALDAVEQYLYAWLRRLRIDKDAAYAVIEGLEAKPPRRRRLKSGGRRKLAAGLDEYYSSLLHRKAMCRMTVDTLHDQAEGDGKRDFVVDQYGRVHTAVTRLLTQARACLSIDGQPLVSLDIRNSQLVFFALLVLESFYSEAAGDDDAVEPFGWYAAAPGAAHTEAPSPNAHRRGCLVPPVLAEHAATRHEATVPEERQEAPPPQCETTASVHISPRSINRKKPTDSTVTQITQGDARGGAPQGLQGMPLPPDVQRFLALTWSGTVYDHLMAQIGVTDRSKFKRTFFRVILYGDPGEAYVWGTKLHRLFRKQFPTVLKFVEWAKRHRYQDLAHRMQERESRFVIGAVCGRLMEHHPDVPVVTVHDSILTTPPHVRTVHRVMMEEFARLGVRPSIKVEGGSGGAPGASSAGVAAAQPFGGAATHDAGPPAGEEAGGHGAPGPGGKSAA